MIATGTLGGRTMRKGTARKWIFFALLVASGSGCATTYIRYLSTNNATEAQFTQDRYQCYEETQQRVSGSFVNQYGGAASSQVLPSCSAWNACLAARAYYRSDTTSVAELHAPGSLFVPQGA